MQTLLDAIGEFFSSFRGGGGGGILKTIMCCATRCHPWAGALENDLVNNLVSWHLESSFGGLFCTCTPHMSANPCMIRCFFGISPGSNFVDFLCEESQSHQSCLFWWSQCIDGVFAHPAHLLETYIFQETLVPDLQRAAWCVWGCHSVEGVVDFNLCMACGRCHLL